MSRRRKVIEMRTAAYTKADIETRRREESIVTLPSDQLVSPPSYLKGKEAQREWRRVVPLLEQIGVFGNLDKSNLAAYCYNYGEWVELIRKRSALSITSIGDPEDFKILQAIDKQIKVHEDQFRRFGSACGMDPSGRLKAAAKQTQTEQETIEARFGAI